MFNYEKHKEDMRVNDIIIKMLTASFVLLFVASIIVLLNGCTSQKQIRKVDCIDGYLYTVTKEKKKIQRNEDGEFMKCFVGSES